MCSSSSQARSQPVRKGGYIHVPIPKWCAKHTESGACSPRKISDVGR